MKEYYDLIIRIVFLRVSEVLLMKYKTKHTKVLWFIFCIALNYWKSVRQIYLLKTVLVAFT